MTLATMSATVTTGKRSVGMLSLSGTPRRAPEATARVRPDPPAERSTGRRAGGRVAAGDGCGSWAPRRPRLSAPLRGPTRATPGGVPGDAPRRRRGLDVFPDRAAGRTPGPLPP